MAAWFSRHRHEWSPWQLSTNNEWQIRYCVLPKCNLHKIRSTR